VFLIFSDLIPPIPPLLSALRITFFLLLCFCYVRIPFRHFRSIIVLLPNPSFPQLLKRFSLALHNPFFHSGLLLVCQELPLFDLLSLTLCGLPAFLSHRAPLVLFLNADDAIGVRHSCSQPPPLFEFPRPPFKEAVPVKMRSQPFSPSLFKRPRLSMLRQVNVSCCNGRIFHSQRICPFS